MYTAIMAGCVALLSQVKERRLRDPEMEVFFDTFPCDLIPGNMYTLTCASGGADETQVTGFRERSNPQKYYMCPIEYAIMLLPLFFFQRIRFSLIYGPDSDHPVVMLNIHNREDVELSLTSTHQTHFSRHVGLPRSAAAGAVGDAGMGD